MTPQINNLWREYKKAIETGQLSDALANSKAGLDCCFISGDIKHAGIWRRAVAHVLYLQGEYEKAAKEAKLSVEMQDDPYEKALSLLAMGQMQTFLGRYKSAFYYFDKAVRLGSEFPDDVYLWTHLFGIRAIAHRRTGKFDKAIIDWEGSAALLRRQGFFARAAAYLNNIGFLLLRGKHLREAEQRLLEALELIDLDPDRDTEGSIYDSLGCVYTQMDQHSNADRFLSRAIKVFEALGNRAQLAGSLIHLSVLYEKLTRYDDAHEAAVRALDLARESKNEPLVAEAREQLKCVTLSRIRESQMGQDELVREVVLSAKSKVVSIDDYRILPKSDHPA